MRLLIDIGNTRIKGGLWKAGQMRLLPPLPYQNASLEGCLDSWNLPGDLADCRVASVGHAEICQALDEWLSDRYGIPVSFPQSTASACGVINAYDIPSNLGVDRWLGLIAARAMEGRAIIVSAGTAATIDVLDETGRHLGGLITPGISTQRRAMLEHTQVRANTDVAGLAWLGTGTDECVTSGTVHAVAGYVERVVRHLQSQESGWRLLISGGDADVLLPCLEGDWQSEPDLVLKGLAILSESSAIQD